MSEALAIGIGSKGTILREVLEQFRMRRENHNGYLVLRLEVTENLSRTFRERLQNRTNGVGEIEEKYHREGQLVMAEIGDVLRNSIL
jgi:hypothetical protein